MRKDSSLPQSRSRGPKTIKATAADVLRILNSHASDVVLQLGIPIRQVQLSMPLDDLGPRIKVSLREKSEVRVPKTLSFDLEGRRIRVPLERADDFQDFKLH